jgi:hypothetical protein
MHFVSLIAAASIIAASAAFAADVRKIDFTAVITDIDDAPLVECSDPATIPATDPACKAKKTVTLGLVAMRALITPEQGVSPEDNLMRGQLAISVAHSNGAELKAEEVALIKKRIGTVYGPLIVARTFPMLDPAAK